MGSFDPWRKVTSMAISETARQCTHHTAAVDTAQHLLWMLGSVVAGYALGWLYNSNDNSDTQ